MSTHLLIAAAYLTDLPQATKLVLMAVADSADEQTLEAAPGLPKLRAWSNLGKSQTLAVVRKLVDDGLLEQIGRAHTGRRAVYRVFPAGVPTIPHPTEVAARYAPSGSGGPDPVDLSSPVDDDPSLWTSGSGGPDPVAPSGSDMGPRGSGGPDPFSPTLQSSSGRRSSTPTRPVDTSTPPARRTTPGGFPGSRTVTATPTPVPDHPRCPDHPRHLLLRCPACEAAKTAPPAGWRKAAQVKP